MKVNRSVGSSSFLRASKGNEGRCASGAEQVALDGTERHLGKAMERAKSGEPILRCQT
jgi:hypothetical protein